MTGSINKKDFKRFIEKFAPVLDATGEFLIEMGKSEQNNPEVISLIEKLNKDPNAMQDLLEEIPTEYSTKFFGILLKLGLVTQAYQKTQGNPRAKIEVGKQLKSISAEIAELVK